MVKKGNGKGKKSPSPHKKQSEASRAYGLAKRLSSEKQNPFDKFANAKKKHEVVNRRVKGEDRNVGRARAKAVEERRKRLLGDFQRNKKTNVFNDRRFGENDTEMSLEEKMFARFQKEKVRKARNLSQFNLDDGDAGGGDVDMLTHKGQVLGDSNYGNQGDWSDNEDDEGLDRDVVNSMHFGGGMVPKAKATAEGDEDEGQPQGGRMEKQLTALQEIVMKSKMAKAQKKEAKDEQEAGREKLDADFESLMRGNVLRMSDNHRDFQVKRLKADGTTEKGEYDDYDKNMMEMQYEAKVKATSRTKTAEELAVEERERLEEAEKERVKRMREGPDLESAAELDEAGNHGMLNVAPKRGKSTGEKGLAEEGIAGFLSEEEEEEGDEDEDEDEEEEEDEDEDEEDTFESDEGEENEEVAGAAPARGPRNKAYPMRSSTAKSEKEVANDGKAIEVNPDMPHTLPCPPDLDSFRELCEKYVKNGTDYVAMVTRIVGYHSVKLPGKEGVDNKSRMHNFLGVLMAEFSAIGDGLAYTASLDEQADLMMRLDSLMALVFQLCRDMEGSVTSLWAKAIKQLLGALQKRLRDYAHGVRHASTWPRLGKVLFLQLLGRTYSVTDLQHALVTPAMLLMCQYLTQCQVVSLQDVSTGLLVCSVLMDYTDGSKRYIPEVTSFLCRLLGVLAQNHSASASGSFHIAKSANSSSNFNVNKLCWLSLVPREEDEHARAAKKSKATERAPPGAAPAANQGQEGGEGKIPWRYFSAAGTVPEHTGEDDATSGVEEGPRSSVALLGVALSLVKQLLGRHGASAAFPEIASPLLSALMDVSAAVTTLDGHKEERVTALINEVSSVLQLCGAQATRKQDSRSPLAWRNESVSSIEAKNPIYAMNYTFKKDNDADGDRAKMKQLQRQLKRETKAAQRELRRDSEFLDREAFKDKQEAHDRRRAERSKNFAFMEEQQATINQQVRLGGGLMKGGGSGVIKGKVVKRERKKGK